MIKKLELWARRLSKRNFDAFQNLKTFLESADEELSNEVLDFFYPASARSAMQFSRVLSTSR
jgi:hypothetical protein